MHIFAEMWDWGVDHDAHVETWRRRVFILFPLKTYRRNYDGTKNQPTKVEVPKLRRVRRGSKRAT